jgi:hypothetical protein
VFIQRGLSISAASPTHLKFLSLDLEWRRRARRVKSERASVFMIRKSFFSTHGLAGRESIEVRASDICPAK